jgi:hypothetical protein
MVKKLLLSGRKDRAESGRKCGLLEKKHRDELRC